MKPLYVEVTYIDQKHKIAVLVFIENGDAIMLPLDLLPKNLTPGRLLRITIENGETERRPNVPAERESEHIPV